MRSNTKKRLARLQEVIGQAPIPADQRRAAFETFRATGELPEDDRLAMGVIDRVRRGYELPDGPLTGINWSKSIEAMMNTPKRAKDEFMDSLLNEALYGPGMVKAAARAVLQLLASQGIDVTGTPFHDHPMELPAFGSVGMDFLGFPQQLALPPYVRQARRLFARIDDLRRRLLEHPKWQAPLDRAVEQFQRSGERPSEEVLMEAVLVLGEMHALMRHACGDDVTELMARFDEIARAKGKARRDEAIGKLQAMAEAGLLAPKP